MARGDGMGRSVFFLCELICRDWVQPLFVLSLFVYVCVYDSLFTVVSNHLITSSIKKHLFTRWQHLWHNSTCNKLYNIYPTLPINSNYLKAQLTRQEQTLYNRLRIGHTYLTHSYLLKDEDPPICIPCNSLLTVEHILSYISCIDFDIIRQNFYTASNLKDLFHNIHPKRIISSVHAIGLTNKL